MTTNQKDLITGDIAAEILGLNPVQFRIWNKRMGVPSPVIQSGGGRPSLFCKATIQEFAKNNSCIDLLKVARSIDYNKKTYGISNSDLITIIQIADMTGYSIKTIQQNRKKLGIPEPKQYANGNLPAIYSRHEIIEWMKAKGITEDNKIKYIKEEVISDFNLMAMKFIAGKFDPKQRQDLRKISIDLAKQRKQKRVVIKLKPEWYYEN